MRYAVVSHRKVRCGAIVPLLAFLMVFLVAMVAFSVDIGYMIVVHQQLQNTADSAAFAGASQLLDDSLLKMAPNQTQAIANANAEAQTLSQANYAGGVSLNLVTNPGNDAGGDVVCGYLSDPNDLSQGLDFTKFPNSVQVIVRRDTIANGSLSMFFAKALGVNNRDLEAKATATFKDRIVGFKIQSPGYDTCKLLPFALSVDTWNQVLAGNGPDLFARNETTGAVTSGSDGIHETKLFPLSNGSTGSGGLPAGNFGTINIGSPNNSTATLVRQIEYGPNATDLSYYPNGTLQLDAVTGTLTLNGDTGVSAGVKSALVSIIGQPRVIPLYQSVSGPGNNAEYVIVGFAGITVTEVVLTGSLSSKHLTIQPCFCIDPNAVAGTTVTTPSYFVYNPVALTR